MALLEGLSEDPRLSILSVSRYPDTPFFQTSFRKIERISLGGLKKYPVLDCLILAVPDDHIAKLAEQLYELLERRQLPVAHTAGAVELQVLLDAGFTNVGVFYPLQSFSKGRSVHWEQIPFLIEASTPSLSQDLITLASSLSKQVYKASTVERQRIHLGAVFVNNFTNALLGMAQEIADELNPHGHRLYLPLLHETVAKLETLSPEEAQTGPARRADHETIARHLDYLSEHHPQLKKTYIALTEYIQETHHSALIPEPEY
jgi:predicted short-subunit dehydrogenase-like oxidoreductase (DUF2520 family)